MFPLLSNSNRYGACRTPVCSRRHQRPYNPTSSGTAPNVIISSTISKTTMMLAARHVRHFTQAS